MNSVKIIALTLFFASSLISSTSFAQSSADNLTEEQKEGIRKNVEEYATSLNLSEDQKPKFADITQKYAEQMNVVRDSDARRRSKFKKVKAIQKSKDAEMKTLLSEDQYKVYLVKKEEMKKRMKESRKKNK